MNRLQLISAATLAFLLGGYWLFLAKGEVATIRGLESSIRQLHSARYLSELEAVQLDEFQARADEAQGWLQAVVDSHTIDGAQTDLSLVVNAHLDEHELVTHASTPGPVVDHELLKEQTLELHVEGTPERLLEFLKRMEESQPFCRVTRLRVEPISAEGRVRAELVLTRLWRAA